jgi:hypothetical protein
MKYDSIDILHCRDEEIAKELQIYFVNKGYSVGLSSVEIETGTHGKHVVKRLDILEKADDSVFLEESKRMDLLEFVENATAFIYDANDAITFHMATYGLDELSNSELADRALELSEQLNNKAH